MVPLSTWEGWPTSAHYPFFLRWCSRTLSATALQSSGAQAQLWACPGLPTSPQCSSRGLPPLPAGGSPRPAPSPPLSHERQTAFFTEHLAEHATKHLPNSSRHQANSMKQNTPPNQPCPSGGQPTASSTRGHSLSDGHWGLHVSRARRPQGTPTGGGRHVGRVAATREEAEENPHVSSGSCVNPGEAGPSPGEGHQ